MPQVNDEITVNINGRARKLTITNIFDNEDHPKAKADMQARGWDGSHYYVTGARGASYLCFRTPKGTYSMVFSCR